MAIQFNYKSAGIFSFGVMVTLFSLGCDANKSKPDETKKEVASQDTTRKDTAQAVKDKFEWQALATDTTKQYIYLTFDDGPQNGTVACLDLCKKLGVKATFFMVAAHADNPHLKSIVQNIKASYPEILLANHSTTHANGHYKYFYHHPYMAAEDFYGAQSKMAVPYKIIRLPGNSAWVTNNRKIKASHLVKPVCSILDSSNYAVIGWDVEWSFSHKTENPIQRPEKIARWMDSALARNHVHTANHVVLLTHDRMFRNQNYTDSLAKFIGILKQNPRYVFETIDHYPGAYRK